MRKYLLTIIILCGYQFASVAQENDIVISDAWTRPITVAGRPGGAYLTITNNTGASDQLLSASSPISPRLEIHEHSMADGVMKMRQVEFVEIPANQTVEFEPGGYHIMIFDSVQYAIGDEVELVLTFKNAGSVKTTAHVAMKKP